MSEFLRDVDRAQLIRYVGIYMLIAGVLTLCGGLALTVAGGLGGLVGAGTFGFLSGTAGSEGAAAATGLMAASGLALIYGILSIVTGPLMVVVGYGLLKRLSWARMGTVIIAGLSVISSLIGLITGGGIINLVWVVASGFIAYLFYTDPGIKSEFGQA